MVEPVVIDPELIRKKTSLVDSMHLVRPSVAFYEQIAKRDSAQGPGGLSSEAATSRDAFKHFLGTAAAARESLNGHKALNCNWQARQNFIDLFSYYSGAAAGLSKLQSYRKPSAPGALKGKHPLDFSKGEGVLLDDLIKSYLDGTSNCRNGEALLACTNDYLEWVISDAMKQKDNARFSDLNRAVDGLSIKLDGITVKGFSYYRMDKSEACVWSVKREDYVGNEQFLSFLGNAFTELLDFDFKEKKNPHSMLGGFKQTFTVWGEPGTGKTMGISLAYTEAQEKAKKQGIPLFFRELRGFKSQYFGESANNIRKLFDETRKADGAYVIVAEDIDTIFFSRESLKDRKEDEDIIGEFMNQLEGVTANNLGNYLLIATSNHPMQGDNALMDRLRQGQIEVKGPQNPAEYSAVFKSKLRMAMENRYVAVRDWDKIGSLAFKHSLSNRDVRNICLGVLDTTKNYSRTPEFYSLGFADRVKCLSSNRKCVGDNEILGSIGEYAAGIELQKKKDFEASVQSQIDQYIINKEVANRIKGL